MKVKIVFAPSEQKKDALYIYARNICSSLREKSGIEKIDEIYLKNPDFFGIPEFLTKLTNKDFSFFAKNLILVVKEDVVKDEILHFTNQQQCLILNFKKYKKTVVTVHDVEDIISENLKKYKFPWNYLLALRIKGVKKADRLIAVSEDVKKDIIKHLKYPEDKIDVIHEGIDHDIFKPIASPERKEGVSLNHLNILFAGTEIPRKNLVRLIEAMSIVKKTLPNARLIKVGGSLNPEGRKLIKNKISELGLEESVIFVDEVSQQDLAHYYNQVDLFAFPSLYEGFGFPPLEAMACGCPVVCSNKGSLPEVAGDAALIVNAEDVRDIADKITIVLTDDNLRKNIINKGFLHVKKFTWENAANKTIKVYQKL